MIFFPVCVIQKHIYNKAFINVQILRLEVNSVVPKCNRGYLPSHCEVASVPGKPTVRLKACLPEVHKGKAHVHTNTSAPANSGF